MIQNIKTIKTMQFSHQESTVVHQQDNHFPSDADLYIFSYSCLLVYESELEILSKG